MMKASKRSPTAGEFLFEIDSEPLDEWVTALGEVSPLVRDSLAQRAEQRGAPCTDQAAGTRFNPGRVDRESSGVERGGRRLT
jgi:hypothetical protein